MEGWQGGRPSPPYPPLRSATGTNTNTPCRWVAASLIGCIAICALLPCTLQVCNTPKRYILKTIRTFCLALKAIFFKEVLNIKNSNFIKTPHLRHNQWPDDVIGESFSLLKSNCESTIFGSVIWPILIAFILQLRQQQQKMHVSLYVAAHDVILILVLNVIDI